MKFDAPTNVKKDRPYYGYIGSGGNIYPPTKILDICRKGDGDLGHLK
jgi:hypothetical protein